MIEIILAGVPVGKGRPRFVKSTGRAFTPEKTVRFEDRLSIVAQEAMADVIKRGRRLDETTPGSGLGLSIVVDLAKLYGGGLTLEHSPLGGLRARLILPAV